MNNKKWSLQLGVTLIELMVTLIVAGILAMVAVPSFKTITTNRHADKLAQQLQIDLMYARSHALSSSKEVTVKRALIGQTPSYGWRICENNRACDQSAGASLLRETKANAKVDEIEVSTNEITFDKFGRLLSGKVKITVKVDGCTGSRVRTITLNKLGQITTKEAPCG